MLMLHHLLRVVSNISGRTDFHNFPDLVATLNSTASDCTEMENQRPWSLIDLLFVF